MRSVRTKLHKTDSKYSVRQFAERLGTTPAHISNIETGKHNPPEDRLLAKIADDLGQDHDVFFAAANRLTDRLRNIVVRRPELIASLLNQVEKLPDDAVVRLVREVRDGEW